MAIKLDLNQEPFIQKDTEEREDRAARLLGKAMGKAFRSGAAKSDSEVKSGATLENSPEKKADAKPEAEPEAKADAKPEAKADVKPGAKADVKPDVKPEAEPEAKADVKPGAKADAKPDVKADAKPGAKAGVKPGAKADAKPDAEPDVKPDVKADAKPGAKADVKPGPKADVKPEAKAGAKADAKAEAEPDVKPEAKADVKPEAKADVKPEAKADVKPGVKADAKADVEADAKADVEADAKADVKADVTMINNILNSKRITMFLSVATEYSLLSDSQINVLSEICKLCILSGKLSTEKISYEFLAEKAAVNGVTVKGIIRKLEACQILVKKDQQYVSGSKGRVFEVSQQALHCMLSNNQGLKRWLARNGLRVNDIKNFYNFQ